MNGGRAYEWHPYTSRIAGDKKRRIIHVSLYGCTGAIHKPIRHSLTRLRSQYPPFLLSSIPNFRRNWMYSTEIINTYWMYENACLLCYSPFVR
jgi:hypothetical protein